jgi:hypothetical protein
MQIEEVHNLEVTVGLPHSDGGGLPDVAQCSCEELDEIGLGGPRESPTRWHRHQQQRSPWVPA